MTEAVQTLEPSTHRYKRGDVMPNGGIFWGYRKKFRNGKYIVSTEKYNDLKEKSRIYSSSYRASEPIKRKALTSGLYQKQWRQNNQEKCKDYRKRYNEINKDKKKTAINIYRKQNIDKIRENRRLYERKKRQLDPLYRFSQAIRTRISQSLKVNGFPKNSNTEEILGCDFVFLKKYIENMFEEGMNWSNQGKWHFDHIIPICTAKSEEEIVKLNHYTNLRPLWAIDNLRKGKKIPMNLSTDSH